MNNINNKKYSSQSQNKLKWFIMELRIQQVTLYHPSYNELPKKCTR